MKKQLLSILLCLILISTATPVVHAEKAKYYINPYFDNVGVFKEGLVAVQKENKWGYIDKAAKEVIKMQYEDAMDFSEGLAAVKKNGKWGFIDKAGNEIIPFKYDNVRRFYKGTATVQMKLSETEGSTVNNLGGGFVELYIDMKGNQVPDPRDSPEDHLNDGMFMFHQDNSSQWGYKDKNGNVVVKPIYADLGNFFEGLARATRYPDTGFINMEGKEVIKPQFKAAKDFSGGYAAVKKDDGWNGKWGFIDKSGKEVVEAQFYDVRSFSEGIAGVQEYTAYGHGLWGFILAPNQAASVKPDLGRWEAEKAQALSDFVVKPVYDEVREFHNGMAAVAIGVYPFPVKWGFVDKSGKEAVKPKYDRVYDFSDDLGMVIIGKDQNSKYGFVDKQGNEIIKPKYMYAEPFFEGKALVAKGAYSEVLIDKTGRELKENVKKYKADKFIKTSDKSLGRFMTNGKWGLTDNMSDKVIVPAKYDDAMNYAGGIAAVKLNGKWGYVDSSGKEIVKPQFDDAGYFSNDILAAVKINKKWGFVNKSGKLVIDAKYDFVVVGFSKEDGLAAVSENGKFGYIDMKGNWVVQPQFNYASVFREGLSGVRTETFEEGLFGSSMIDGNWGVIDKTGKMVLSPKRYAYVGQFYEGLASVYKNEKWGFIAKPGLRNN